MLKSQAMMLIKIFGAVVSVMPDERNKTVLMPNLI